MSYNMIQTISFCFVIPAILFLILWGGFMIHQYMKRKKRIDKYLKDFDGPEGHWLYGNVQEITLDEKMFSTWLSHQARYGMNFKYKFLHEDILLVSEPNALATVTKSDIPKTKEYKFFADYVGQGILMSDGPKWYRNRQLLTPAFHFEILKPYTEIFTQTVGILVNKWKAQCDENMGKATTLEMFKQFSLMTLDSLLKTAFSTDIKCQEFGGEKHPYIAAVNYMTEVSQDRIRSLLLHSDFIFYYLTQNGRNASKAIETIKNFGRNMVSTRMKIKEKNPLNFERKYRNFVDMLLDARDTDGQGLSQEEILDEVGNFMFAGHDTTTSALSWLMYNLARHPEYQQRCREEVMEILDGKEKLEWADLSRLEYLTMCIKESLRLHSPVPSVGRLSNKDILLPDGKTIPENCTFWINIYLVHHNPNIWSDPEVYDPSRFTPENSQGRHSHAFMPFSAGPRNCIGQNFALNEMKITAAYILNNFYLEINPDYPPPEVMADVVLHSKSGIWIKIQPI